MAVKRRKNGRKKSGRSAGARGLQSVGGAIFRMLPLVVLAGLVYIGFGRVKQSLFADPLLEVRTLAVSPVDVLPPEAKAALQKKWLGRNIFSVDLAQVSRDVTARPEILRAEVVRILPGTLSIRAQKRQPFACVQTQKNGEEWLISEDGMILEKLTGPTVALAKCKIQLEAFSEAKTPVPGQAFPVKGFERAVEFYRAFMRDSLAEREKITRLSLDYLGNLTFYLADGPAVKVGNRPLDLMGQFYKLAPFLDPAERKGIDYVDLQFKDVVVKRRKR